MTWLQETACKTIAQNAYFISYSHTVIFVVYRIDRNNVIKVADFGLSEDVYARNYFRQASSDEEDGEGPVKLPVRWMALESLNDGVFSEKTDVVGSLRCSLKRVQDVCVCLWCSGHLE